MTSQPHPSQSYAWQIKQGSGFFNLAMHEDPGTPSDKVLLPSHDNHGGQHLAEMERGRCVQGCSTRS